MYRNAVFATGKTVLYPQTFRSTRSSIWEEPSFHYSGMCVCVCFRATLVAYGSSQARGQIRAVASGLHHSHSNMGSELHLQATP